ncbi:VTT domain-containing protein [Dietzia sp. NPDC055343]
MASLDDLIGRALGDGLTAWAAAPTGTTLVVVALMALPLGPAEVTALAAGALAASSGVSPWQAVATVAFGMALGDVVVYLIGGPLERALRRHTRAAAPLDRWRSRVAARPVRRDACIVAFRFLPGARTPTALASRGAGVGAVRYVLLVVTGSLAWSALWVVAGEAVGAVPGLPVSVLAVAGVLMFPAVVSSSRRLSRHPSL